ncbi:hypothetical protein SGCOL_009555 [Colletotrichum sp. CLE4]
MRHRVSGKRKASEFVGDIEDNHERYGGEQFDRDHKKATDAMKTAMAANEKAKTAYEEAADVFHKASLAP